MTNAQASQSFCRLLELPPELRNTIYEYVFTDNRGERMSKSGHRIVQEPGQHALCKALLCTCRQIYSEGRGLYRIAYRTYISTGVLPIAVQTQDVAGIRKILAPYSTGDMLRFRKIYVQITNSRRNTFILTKQTPAEKNRWRDWYVQVGLTLSGGNRVFFTTDVRWHREFEPKFQKLEDRWRETGVHCEAAAALELHLILWTVADLSYRY